MYHYQAIGAFFTGLGDKTYGVATNLPWGVDLGDGVMRHPTQLYETLFLLVYIGSRYRWKNGDLFRLFRIGYFAFRLHIDFIKPDYHIFST